ncbi:hypothetical protein [Providencia hangzhouensis]|uniref:hypothetical protein n=1 Tax=Providencia hangzhouensis TaxID=3031799 RepID=UPI002AB509D1|nr:hypothetical protein [Providencia rettgeri]
MTELESHQKIRLGLLKLTGNNTAATAKASINQLNSVKSWIKAFRKNKKKPLCEAGLK